MTFGFSSGIGVGYRRYLNDIVALRVEGGIIAALGSVAYSAGLTVQEDMLRTFYYRLYGMQAVAVHHAGDSTWLVPGAGLGFEYNFAGLRKGLAVRGELVLSPLIEVQKAESLGLFLLTPLPQAGISYVF